jgi:hypothetical protein
MQQGRQRGRDASELIGRWISWPRCRATQSGYQRRPLASITMSQVRFAISHARSPALAESSTITRLRSGFSRATCKQQQVIKIVGAKNLGLSARHADSNRSVYQKCTATPLHNTINNPQSASATY